MDQQLKENVTSGALWLRLLYMVFFAVCLQVARMVMWAVVGLQFFFALITGKDNGKLREFGLSLSTFIFDALKFLTYNSDEKPFPFSDWPIAEAPPLEGEVEVAQEQNAPASDAAEPQPGESSNENPVNEKSELETDKTD